MEQEVAAAKVSAAKQVAAAHEQALHAINKVKEHVEKLKAGSEQHSELAHKQEVAVVKRIAGKAALVVNAANLVSALHAKGGSAAGAAGAAGAGGKTSVNALKKKVRAKMAKDKKTAEDAALRWK